LFEDYTAEKALLVLREMALGGCQEMMRRHVVAGSVSIGVAYSSSLGIPTTGGAMRIPRATALYSAISEYVDEIFRKTTHRGAPIRRLAISFDVIPEGSEGYDLFSNIEAEERERCLEGTVLKIKDRFGKNAILRGFDLEDGATARERNRMIGGHNGE
jgi:DNA polymerase V